MDPVTGAGGGVGALHAMPVGCAVHATGDTQRGPALEDVSNTWRPPWEQANAQGSNGGLTRQCSAPQHSMRSTQHVQHHWQAATPWQSQLGTCVSMQANQAPNAAMQAGAVMEPQRMQAQQPALTLHHPHQQQFMDHGQPVLWQRPACTDTAVHETVPPDNAGGFLPASPDKLQDPAPNFASTAAQQTCHQWAHPPIGQPQVVDLGVSSMMPTTIAPQRDMAPCTHMTGPTQPAALTCGPQTDAVLAIDTTPGHMQAMHPPPPPAPLITLSAAAAAVRQIPTVAAVLQRGTKPDFLANVQRFTEPDAARRLWLGLDGDGGHCSTGGDSCVQPLAVPHPQGGHSYHPVHVR
jgi:hypothetical protein